MGQIQGSAEGGGANSHQEACGTKKISRGLGGPGPSVPLEGLKCS